MVVVAVLALPAGAQKLSIAQVVGIKYPSGWQWTDRGRAVSFTWDAAGVSQRYRVDADHPGEPELILAQAAQLRSGFRGGRGQLSPDGKLRLLSRGGASVAHDTSFPEIGNKLEFRISERTAGKLYVEPVAGGDAVPLQEP
ncbi:MAG: hypothetical protein ACRD1E_03265, partial [Terriglobales bacterium]